MSHTHRRPRLLAVAALLAALAGLVLVAPPASADSAGPYQIIMRNSNKCLDNTGGSSANGNPIAQWDCAAGSASNYANQVWVFDWTNNGYARIRNVSTGKCLNVQGASTADTARLILWTCGDAIGNDEWYGTPRSDGYYQLKVRHSLKCMDVRGASVANGAALQQYHCYDAPNQNQFWVSASGVAGW